MPNLRTCLLETPLGPMLAASVEDRATEAICLLEFHDRRALPTERRELERIFQSDWPEPTAPAGILANLADELDRYFAGNLQTFSIPLSTPGTPFRRKVWEQLQTIPYGRTISYLDLAQRVHRPGGSRAVGQANGANRIAIVVPCHRVIAADGALGGYGGKLWRKQWLLDLERGQPRSLPNVPALAAAHG